MSHDEDSNCFCKNVVLEAFACFDFKLSSQHKNTSRKYSRCRGDNKEVLDLTTSRWETDVGLAATQRHLAMKLQVNPREDIQRVATNEDVALSDVSSLIMTAYIKY
jgi:hypothetical protein